MNPSRRFDESPRSVARRQLFGDDLEIVDLFAAPRRSLGGHALTLLLSVLSIAMVVTGLRWWDDGIPMKKAACIGWVAAGQLVLLYGVVGRMIRPGRLDLFLRTLAVLVFIAAVGGTIALALVKS